MEKDATCPEDMICFTEDEWSQFVTDYELDIIDEIGGIQPESTGDAQAVADFTWQVLFLTPWELAYIALPLSLIHI